MKQTGVNAKAFNGADGIHGLGSFAQGLGNAANGVPAQAQTFSR